MRRYGIAILCVGILGAIFIWFSGDKKVNNTKVKDRKPVVHNISEEKTFASGSENLGDGIHNTHIFLDFILNENNGSSFSFNDVNMQTVIGYEKGAIELANKVNASKDIKETLKSSLTQTQKAVANQDKQILNEVDKSLNSLDHSYN